MMISALGRTSLAVMAGFTETETDNMVHTGDVEGGAIPLAKKANATP